MHLAFNARGPRLEFLKFGLRHRHVHPAQFGRVGGGGGVAASGRVSGLSGITPGLSISFVYKLLLYVLHIYPAAAMRPRNLRVRARAFHFDETTGVYIREYICACGTQKLMDNFICHCVCCRSERNYSPLLRRASRARYLLYTRQSTMHI